MGSSSTFCSMASRAAKIAVCVCCISLAGCFFENADRPADWAPAETGAKDCSALNGSYEDMGEHVTGKNARQGAILSFLLFKDAKKEKGDDVPDSVSISVSNDSGLEFTSWSNGRPILTKKYAADSGKYRCDDGTITASAAGGGSAGLAVGAGSATISLSRSTDGALVVKVATVAVGVGVVPFILPILPFGASTTDWYHFERQDARTRRTAPVSSTH